MVPVSQLNALTASLGALSIKAPSDEQLHRFSDWMRRACLGGRVSVVSPICPDYSYQRSADRRIAYTFEAVREGLGVAGETVVRLVPDFHDFLRESAAVKDADHHACFGDFEGFSSDLLRVLNVTPDEFSARVERSVERCRHVGASVLKSTRKISSFCDGRSGWERELKGIHLRARHGEFAELLDKSFLCDIGRESILRFERLFGAEIGQELEHPSMLASLTYCRAVEFATVGKIISGAFIDPLILSIGDGRAAQFFGLAVNVPVLDLSYRPIV